MNTIASIKENNIKLQLTRVFDARREMVWKAWTDAGQFTQWFGAAACATSMRRQSAGSFSPTDCRALRY